jgi:hypothetical protein
MQMVNAGFPGCASYGFEKVDVAGASGRLRESRHQSKIYIESNRSGFRQIFGGLTSTQTSAV